MAFKPVRTFSGGSLPVLVNETAGAGCELWDLVELKATGKWQPEGSTDADSPAQFGVIVGGNGTGNTFADTDPIDVCLVTPDVIFEADSPHADPADMDNAPPWEVDGQTGASTIVDTTAGGTDLQAWYAGMSGKTGYMLVTLRDGDGA